MFVCKVDSWNANSAWTSESEQTEEALGMESRSSSCERAAARPMSESHVQHWESSVSSHVSSTRSSLSSCSSLSSSTRCSRSSRRESARKLVSLMGMQSSHMSTADSLPFLESMEMEDNSALREHVVRSQALATATATLAGTSMPTEVCDIFTTCMEQFWDSSVTVEICLKPAYAPAPLADEDLDRFHNFRAANGNAVLLCHTLSKVGRGGVQFGSSELFSKNVVWLNEEIHEQAWRMRSLKQHDAMQTCLERGVRVSDRADVGWLYTETARQAGQEGFSLWASQAHLFLPLHGHDGCIGVLHLSSPEPDEFTEAKQVSFVPLAEAVGMQLCSLRLQLLLDQERRRQEAIAADYRSMLESMLPAHVIDELTKARSPRTPPNSTKGRRSGSPQLGLSLGSRSPQLGPSSNVPQPLSICRSRSGDKSDHLFPSRRRSMVEDKERLNKLAYAEYHDCVAILFTDIKGFTSLSQQLEPAGVAVMLDDLFGRFDDIVDSHAPMAYKVETIGDAYMVAFGLFEQEPGGGRAALNAVQVASKMVKAASQVSTRLKDGSVVQLEIRAGISLGQIMSGIIGKKMPRYCMFGDTVNTASRMESTGTVGRVHVTESVRDACLCVPKGQQLRFEHSGGREVKGKGFMETYLLQPDQVLSSAP